MFEPEFKYEHFCFSGLLKKNGKLDPLKTEENDHLKFLLQKSVKLFVGNGV